MSSVTSPIECSWPLSYTPSIDKKAELSLRRLRDVPNIWVPRKISRVLTSPRLLFPKYGRLFRSILRTRLQNWKFVALTVPEIIGGTGKKFGSPWIRPRSLFSQILRGFWSHGAVNTPAKFEVCSFTHYLDNRGTQKIWAVSGYAHAPFFQNF